MRVNNKIPYPQKKSDYELSSIDYLILEEDKLVFYEAKHFSNSEIRSRNIPKVFAQIDRYEKALIQHKNEILNSYNLIL